MVRYWVRARDVKYTWISAWLFTIIFWWYFLNSQRLVLRNPNDNFWNWFSIAYDCVFSPLQSSLQWASLYPSSFSLNIFVFLFPFIFHLQLGHFLSFDSFFAQLLFYLLISPPYLLFLIFWHLPKTKKTFLKKMYCYWFNYGHSYWI